jgi:hypothetical protein
VKFSLYFARRRRRIRNVKKVPPKKLNFHVHSTNLRDKQRCVRDRFQFSSVEMSQPSGKRDRDVELDAPTSEATSPPRPQPTKVPASAVEWSPTKFASILADDADDAANAREFRHPTIVTLLSASVNGRETLYPTVIDTTLDDITVWYPSTALNLWTFRRSGEGGEWAATNAFTRIDTIASGPGRDWAVTCLCVRVEGPTMTPDTLTAWALSQKDRLLTNPHALRPSLS